MDVKCENCGTEYEFDDAKVTAAGITVKCTQCGHLFRVARNTGPGTPDARDTQEEAPTRPRHWMIRNRHGEIREFRDLTTLQQWIVERKVAKDDEISKTGETWKPLGSIAELASFFRAVDASAGRGTDEILNGAEPLQRGASSTPPSPRAPPFGAEEVMPTGRFRLEGPRAAPTPIEAARRASGPPMPSTPLDTNPTVPVTRPVQPAHPNVQVHRTPLTPEERAARTLPPTPAVLSRPFTGEAPPREEGGLRGFMTGVLATVALAGLAYFVYDQIENPDPISTPAEAGRRAAGELYQAIERAEGEYEKDTEEAFARADDKFAEVLRLAGDPPQDRALAVRAHLGRARVAMARAEYRKLEGGDPSVLLSLAEGALAEAKKLDEADPSVDLGYADFYRIQGSRQRASKYLSKVEAAGADSDEANLVRAAVNLHNEDWSAAQSRLGKLPASVLERPRARYLLAVTLARSGRTQEAVIELTRLLARHKDHGPARRLLARLEGEGIDELAPPPDAGAGTPATAAPLTAPASEPVKAFIQPGSEAVVSAAPPAPASVAPRAPASVRSAGNPVSQGFDALMDRARKAQESGRNVEARRLLLQALTLRADNPEALASLGWCDVDDNDFPRAISYFRRALTAYSGYADARYGLAVAQERAGQKDEALRTYEDYLNRHPGGRRAALVQERIMRLKGG